jgi:flavin-dependent dehydrogenase
MRVHALVIGAGPAGAATALALASWGTPVLLIDRRPECEWRIGETLSPEAKPVLQRLGVREELLTRSHVPAYGIRSAWGSTTLTEQDFIFNPNGPGWQLDRRAFDQMLCDRAAAAGAAVERGVTIVAMERRHGAWNIETTGRRIVADWIVDASGRRSAFSRRLGITHRPLDRLVAVYRVVRAAADRAQDTRTVVESCADGWWYAAATPGAHRTIAFHTDADLLRRQSWRSTAWWRAKLGATSHLRRLLATDEPEPDREPALVSGSSVRAVAVHGDGWLTVGDAAMAFDPLSGSGLLKALLSAERAAGAIVTATAASRERFAAWNEARWSEFVHARAAHYGAERRWAGATFWNRRRGGEPGVPAAPLTTDGSTEEVRDAI